MKFQQSDNNTIKTSCKNCTFAIYQDKAQVGCLANRIEKFDPSTVIEAYDDENEFYVINRFCNLYRDKVSWNNGKPDTDKAQDESKVLFDIFINCDKISEVIKNNITCWWRDIKSNYGKDKVRVFLFHSSNITKDKISIIKTLFKEISAKNIIVSYDNDLTLHSNITNSTFSYHIICDEIELGILDKINYEINYNLKKAIVIKYKDNYIISNLAYKIESFQNQCFSYSVNIKKIIDNAKQEGIYYIEI